MATPRKKPLVDDGQAVALVPIDSRGRLVEGAGSWPMPVDGDPGAAGDDDEQIPEPQSSADRVMALLSEVADDERAVVKVFRELPNGKQAWCNDYTPGEFEQGGFKMIRRSWGEGTFFVVLYGGTPFRIKSKTKVQIDASRDPEPVAQGSSELSQMLRQMAEGQALMLRAITERPDPMASMTQTLAMMTAMREAMGLNNQKAPEKSTVGELVDALKEMKSASNLFASKDEDEDSLMGIVKQVLPGLVAAIGQAKAGGASPGAAPSFPAIAMPPSIAHAGEVPAGDRPLDMPPSTEENPDMLGLTPEALAAIKMKAFVRALCLMAKAGTPIEEGAELVYEKIPDEALDLLELPVWWMLFVEQFPEVEPWQQWFTPVRDRVIAMLREEETEPAGLPAS